MLTNKGKYGLKAAVYLARMPDHEPALVADIAHQEGISKKFLDTILGELRNAGLVKSRRGRGGGYLLAKSAHLITVGDIVRALDGPIAPIRCVSKNYYQQCDDCSEEKRCAVYLVMRQVRDAMSEILDKRSLADLRSMSGAESATDHTNPDEAGRRGTRTEHLVLAPLKPGAEQGETKIVKRRVRSKQPVRPQLERATPTARPASPSRRAP